MSHSGKSPYKSEPIEKYKDYTYVDWSSEIYDKFKGQVSVFESEFYANIIRQHNLKKILDLGVGIGSDLSGILEVLEQCNHQLETVHGNDLLDVFLDKAAIYFKSKQQQVILHKANWIDLPNGKPKYDQLFDFAFLIGNSLTYIGGATREYTQAMQKSVLAKFASMIEPGGFLLIDTRNYDYIRKFNNATHDEIISKGNFSRSVCYHGIDKIKVLPAYISDSVVVLHYYDLERKLWGKLDFYPLTQIEIQEALEEYFEIVEIFHDFESQKKDNSLFLQFLVRKL